jgi:hypothetical protein
MQQWPAHHREESSAHGHLRIHTCSGLAARQLSNAARHRPNVFRAYRSSADYQLIDLKAANCELLR